MEECGERRERELTERLTTSSILGLFWVYTYIYMYACKCLHSKCGAVRASLLSAHGTVAV